MKAHLVFLAACLALSACRREPLAVQVPTIPPHSKMFPRYPVNMYQMIVSIDQHGKRRIGEKSCDADDALRNQMADFRAQWPWAEIVIEGDKRAPYESVTTIVLMARNAGYSSVTLFLGLPAQDRVVVDTLKLSYE